jgi:multiple sugar transport system substrate-binding protein
MEISRRGVLAGSVGLLAASLTACGGPRRGGPGGGGGRLRVAWWGGQERTTRTNKALELYAQRNEGIELTPDSTSAYDSYWQKITTQASGGNPPDLYQHNYRYLKQFADKGSLLDLDTLPDGTLNLTDVDPSLRDQGMLAGKRWAVPLGANTEAAYLNQAMLTELDLATPPKTWTWDDFATYAKEAAGALGDKVFLCDDCSGSDIVLVPWLLSRGRQLYTAEGQLGLTADDLGEWFAYWAGLRKAGVISPGDVQAQSPPEQRMAERKLIMVWSYSNLMTAFQSLTEDQLAIQNYPTGPAGSPPSHTIIGTGLLMAISASAADPARAGSVINFLINDPEAIGILGTERGVPPSLKAREQLRDGLPETERAALDFFGEATKNPAEESIYYNAPPAAAGEVTALLTRVGQDLSFGKIDQRAAVDGFLSQAEGILG